MQRYFNGHTAFRAAMTLGALCGKIGKPHAGVHWMDGGMLQMVTRLDYTSHWVAPDGKMGGTLPGTRMMDIIANGQPHPVKSLWLTKYGFGTQAPLFKHFVEKVLPELELFAVTEQVMTPAAEYADIVLPCVSFLEEELDLVGGGENFYIQLRQRAVPPVGESRSDWEIFAGLMEHMGQGEPWRMSAEEVCAGILRDHGQPADPRDHARSAARRRGRDGAAQALCAVRRPELSHAIGQDASLSGRAGRVRRGGAGVQGTAGGTSQPLVEALSADLHQQPHRPFACTASI